MSGVAGIFSRAGEAVQAGDVEAMVSILAHRGPDGAGVWRDDGIGLGHRMLFSTPESLSEHQPWFADGCCITADARIDNREELASLLSIDRARLAHISDSQIILAAYQKWGKDCPQKLLGDFAFAIWNSHCQELLCARDPLGVKPFYYYLSKDWFIFASEIKGVLCFPHTPQCLNETWMAGFLMPSGEFNDKESTFYEEILRLPPAHSLMVSRRNSLLTRYWALDQDREIRFHNEDDYSEALREKFTRAVQVRLRSAFPVGSTLSGGLDSSSIACTARNLLQSSVGSELHTFSAVFQKAPDADESSYIHEVLAQGGFIPHILRPDEGNPFVDLDKVLWHLDEPFYGINYFMPWSFYRSASENGIRVLMDGTDGDTTISHGMDYFEILAKRGNWKQFAHEAQAVTRNFDHPRYASVRAILYSYGAPQLTQFIRKGKIFAFTNSVQEINSLFSVSRKRLAFQWGVRPFLPKTVLQLLQGSRANGSDKQSAPTFVAQEFVDRLKTQGFFQKSNHTSPLTKQNGRALHYYYLNLGMLPYSLEMIDRLSAAFSVEVRFPFCDRELVEYCLALPPEMKLKDGWSRYIMRRAMTGILPQAVQWRGGKISLAKVFPYMLTVHGRDTVEEILENPVPQLYQYFNLPVIYNIYESFLKDSNTEGWDWVWQTVIMAAWMKQAGCFTSADKAGL